MTTEAFSELRAQLRVAAEAFAGSPRALPEILSGIVDDVDRALAEPLEIFPVCHHSPASALAMARRLREKRPAVIYLELCEDLQPLLAELRHCRLPVALQAFATEVDGFPREWAPLSVVAPITEASAEYQAIAYALDDPEAEIVLVDRSTDHVYQWTPRPAEKTGDEPGDGPEPADAEEHRLHGDSLGVEIGDLRPGFAELEEHLLRHGRVRHWSEWWDQYVEQPLADADYDTYRQVMVLIGSLFRRLRPGRLSAGDRDEDRERYMWTRMREHLAATGVDPSRAMYVCGAYHAASRVEEFGLTGSGGFAIGERTATAWQYGIIPSSHSAIEAQFGNVPGSISIAAAGFAKAVARGGVKPFRLAGQKGTAGKRRKTPSPRAAAEVSDRLSGFLSRPPVLDRFEEEELLGWSVDIVRLARRNGYLSGTADAIAVFETSILLAGMRDRVRPTPYDFQDAAITCIEKDVVPGRRDVRRLCEILLGGDRIGQVGYHSLPPLARDVYDRLAPLGMTLSARNVRRVLIDLRANPELEPVSRLLWTLHRLLPGDGVRNIMGERRLGEAAIQESWDVALGKHQRDLVELGYEGVTVEQVLEQRLRAAAWGPRATAATALQAVEDSIVYLGSRRFTDELGDRAVELLAAERGVDDAPEVLRAVRRLLAYYQANEPELPRWCADFVVTGYAHYCTLLPTAFADGAAGIRQVAAILGFLLTLKGLALSLGCDGTQLEIAVRQSHPDTPEKTAALWAVHHQLGALSLPGLRERCAELLANPLVVPAFPRYLSGFVQCLDPVPALAGFVVELVSEAFARLPDAVLLPWLPTLVTTLKRDAAEKVPLLVAEAGRTFPGSIAAVDAWVPPWRSPAPQPRERPHAATGPVPELLAAHPAATDALAALLGVTGEWAVPGGAVSEGGPAAELLTAYPATGRAVEALLVA